MEQDKPIIYTLLSIMLLLLLNAVVLDIYVFGKKPNSEIIQVSEPICPSACQDLISELKPATVSSQPVLKITPTNYVVQSSTVLPKESYIPLGPGTSKSPEFEFLTGAEATIDTSNYPGLKEVVFEVFFQIPTGNGKAYVKLFNVTDKHDVWFSEVSNEGGQLVKREAKIKLDSGNKTYRVMAKSTMQYEVKIEQSRLKITTD